MQQFLEELSIQQLIEKYSFVIPEIQREYVWGNNEHNILDKFFKDIKEGIREKPSSVQDLTRITVLEQMLDQVETQEKEVIIKMLEKYKKDLNIGFIYSYKPDYYLPNNQGEDAYLIDGQQRFTTLFLALLYFSLKESDNKEDFRRLFRFNPKQDRIAFDYRVRSQCHQFLMDLITNCECLDDLNSLTLKTWFLSSFKGDVTIKGMVDTLSKLHGVFGDDEQLYYQFIKKQIKFWHFKTEETTQGEELYITMNSRGQQLSDNETIRAKLFESDLVKHRQIEWGAKWEQWQDFFWRHRVKGSNADFGFNQFLRWVNVIECLTREEHRNIETAEKRYKTLIAENTVLEYVTLEHIEPYYNSLAILMDLYDKKHFGNEHFKENFNPRWLSNAPNQVNLISLLPALMFLTKEASPDKLNRYVRFFSNAARDIDIAKNPDTFIVQSIQLTKAFLEAGHTDVLSLLDLNITPYSRLITSEEVWKFRQLKGAESGINRKQIEEVLWAAEDFDVNKGKIGHLIQASLYTGYITEFVFKKNMDYSTLGCIDLERLGSVFSSYKEMYNNKSLIRGDLLPSSVYRRQVDRLVALDWQLNDTFQQFVLRREASGSVPLTKFCIQVEMEFLWNYGDEESIRAERDPAKQLYIYYIYLNRIINNWDWRNGGTLVSIQVMDIRR